MKMKSNPTKTVLTISVGFLIVYLITKSQYQWILIVSASVGIIGLISDYLASKIEWIWMKLTWVLSLTVPNILLSLLFYLFLFPIAVLNKIFSKKNHLQLKNPKKTTWFQDDKVFDSKSMENPW